MVWITLKGEIQVKGILQNWIEHMKIMNEGRSTKRMSILEVERSEGGDVREMKR